MAPLGPAEEALLLGLNLPRHALRVGGVSVAPLGTATAPQLVLYVTPNRHGPRLVDHVFDEADVIPPAPHLPKYGRLGSQRNESSRGKAESSREWVSGFLSGSGRGMRSVNFLNAAKRFSLSTGCHNFLVFAFGI